MSSEPSTKEILDYAETLSRELESEKRRRVASENISMEQMGRVGGKDISTITFLFDTSRDLERAEHLLRGDILVKGVWQPNPNPRNRVLSDLGVQEVINQALLPHLSVSIVLGNITEEQLMMKMQLFCRWLTDFILNRCEDFFEYEKADDIYKRYKQLQLVNPAFAEFTDEELYHDSKRVSIEELQKKITHLPMMIQQISNLVHSRYSASVNGLAFKEVMRNTHVSEITSTSGIMGVGNGQNKGFNLFNPKTWK